MRSHIRMTEFGSAAVGPNNEKILIAQTGTTVEVIFEADDPDLRISMISTKVLRVTGV